MTAPEPGAAALTRWCDAEGTEVDAAQVTPDSLDGLWQEFESKPHYGADLKIDGLTLYTDFGRSVAFFGYWACRRVDDGLPFALEGDEFAERFTERTTA